MASVDSSGIRPTSAAAATAKSTVGSWSVAARATSMKLSTTLLLACYLEGPTSARREFFSERVAQTPMVFRW